MAAPETRQKILDAALDLFRERGFDAATMRDIAARAGVATGLAYYYFASKDAIVLAFYQRTKDALPSMLLRAQQERTLAKRLHAMISAKLEYFSHDRAFLGALLAHAADPANPLSPFNDSSREIREADYAHFDRALRETGTRVPKDLESHLGKMLWFFQMGVLLFWIYDRSPQQKRTLRLLDASVPVVVTLIKLAGLPIFKPARKSVLNIIAVLES